MLQWIRSVVYTVLLFLVTGVFGVIVLVSALLPLSIEQRYVIPRSWGLFLTWLAKAVCGLGYTIEGQESLPQRPFVSLWKHSSVWETLAQMFVVPPAAWSEEVLAATVLEAMASKTTLAPVSFSNSGRRFPTAAAWESLNDRTRSVRPS